MAGIDDGSGCEVRESVSLMRQPPIDNADSNPEIAMRPITRHQRPLSSVAPVHEADMMEEHSSYHNAITGEEAILRLKHSGHPHCYLTRYSLSTSVYVLTVYKKERPADVEEHYPLNIENNKRKIEGKENDYASLAELLHYYEHARINPSLPNIGHNYTLEEYMQRQRAIRGNMMGQHSSYHNGITEEEANRRLRHSSLPHSYLTYFNNDKQTYMLAVYQRQGRNRVEKHFPITISHGMHQLQLDEVMDDQESFESIDRLLQHYLLITSALITFYHA